MKKLLLICCIALLTSCASVKIGGSLTSFTQTDSLTSVGFNIHGDGQLKPKLDSLYSGYAVDIAGQKIQITHSANDFDISGLLNLNRK